MAGTEAGKYLLSIWEADVPGLDFDQMHKHIKAIELEAGCNGWNLHLDQTRSLLDLALTVRRMIEDGHPNDREWFEIMSRALRPVNDLLDSNETKEEL